MEFDVVREFSERCFDVVSPFRMTPQGQVVLEGQFYPLTDWARQQVCKLAGCTPKFFEALVEHEECEVFNKVVGDKILLFRGVRDSSEDYIRAVLSTQYNTSISNVWVIDEIIKKVNFVKVLASKDVQISLEKFDEDFLGVGVSAGDIGLLVLNGETGRVALSFLVKVVLNGFPLTTVIHRKIHTNLDPTVTEDILLESVTTVVTKVNSLTADVLERKFKVRKVDLRLFSYPREVKSVLFDLPRLKVDDVTEITLSQLLERAKEIEDFRWSLILSCDLYNVCTSFTTYVKEGWIVRWPVRTNWLK
ncbi:hypothetical protein J7J18_06520 [bacterium]|nr:hypothetical protein [bacterium]